MLKCRHCGARVRWASSCSYCSGPQPARFWTGVVPLACLSVTALLVVTSARFLGRSAEVFQAQPAGVGMLSEEEVGMEREEVPWVFAAEMAAAVGRDYDGLNRKDPPVGYEE